MHKLIVMAATIAKICRYPVKGLNAQELQSTKLSPGACLPDDRRFALRPGQSDSDQGGWRPKSQLLTLMRHEKLATLQADYDDASTTLTIRRNGRVVAKGDLTTVTGRAVVEQFLAAFFRSEVPGIPKVIESTGTSYTDTQAPLVSLINMASVRDIERIVHQPVHPLRFRGNLYLEGLTPWAEETWVGKALAIGACRLSVVEPIERCAATSVDPETGLREPNIPRALQKGFGHCTCGVYAQVTIGGPIHVGDTVSLA